MAQYSVFYITLQPHSCPSPGEYVYSSLLSPFCEAEIQLECVACYTSRLRHCILAERSVGHATPRCCFSLLVHKLPLSDHWPRRHVWFIDLKGKKQVGLGLDLFQGFDYNGNLEEGKGIDRDDEFPSLCSSSGRVSIISGSRKAQGWPLFCTFITQNSFMWCFSSETRCYVSFLSKSNYTHAWM